MSESMRPSSQTALGGLIRRAAVVSVTATVLVPQGALVGCSMSDRAQMAKAVLQTAAQQNGWPVDEIELDSVRQLDRSGCAFFRAARRAELGRPPAQYAVLPDQKVVGVQDGGAAQVLQLCGKGAPATWWAQIVSWMNSNVRGVLIDEHAPSGKRKVLAAGATWHEPKLETTGRSTTLTYYTYDYEVGVAFRTVAELTNGRLAVSSAPLGSASGPE